MKRLVRENRRQASVWGEAFNDIGSNLVTLSNRKAGATGNTKQT